MTIFLWMFLTSLRQEIWTQKLEKELEVPSTSRAENVIVEEEILTSNVADEVMEDVESVPEYILFKAEIFYLECSVKNPKDVWNEFTIIDMDNFDFSKINSLLNQKSKKLLSTGTKEGKHNEMLWITLY